MCSVLLRTMWIFHDFSTVSHVLSSSANMTCGQNGLYYCIVILDLLASVKAVILFIYCNYFIILHSKYHQFAVHGHGRSLISILWGWGDSGHVCHLHSCWSCGGRCQWAEIRAASIDASDEARSPMQLQVSLMRPCKPSGSSWVQGVLRMCGKGWEKFRRQEVFDPEDFQQR